MTSGGNRRSAVVAGFAGSAEQARQLLRDPDPSTRASALGALDRLGVLDDAVLTGALSDPHPTVRRRAALLAASRPDIDLTGTLGDPDPLVVDAGAWVCGERAIVDEATLAALRAVARDHPDARCREAAVAALGAVGDRRSLPDILAALDDRPAVRRRAVLALAPFDGPEVDAALRRALDDRDWQVRQAAEDLI